MSSGVEVRIIHDHGHLTALLEDLTKVFQRLVERGTQAIGESGDPLLDEAREILALLKEDTYEHFEREEHAFFPNLHANYPELREDLRALHHAHDEICEQIETVWRLLAAASSDDTAQLDQLSESQERLTSLYEAHTTDEWQLIRELLDRLDEASRAVILEQLKEI